MQLHDYDALMTKIRGWQQDGQMVNGDNRSDALIRRDTVMAIAKRLGIELDERPVSYANPQAMTDLWRAESE
jgi:hypothetical protein